jgi:hypothetical protein
MNTINEYFSGEKSQCTIGIAISVVSIALALYFLLQSNAVMYKGMAWPFLIISLLLLSICIGVVWRSPRDIERVNNYVKHESDKIKSEEIPRMENVLKSFKIIKIVEICLLFVGLGLVVFGILKDTNLLTGIGIGLSIQSALMYGFDYFAHERGKVYFEFLQNF